MMDGGLVDQFVAAPEGPRFQAAKCEACGVLACPPRSYHCLQPMHRETVSASARVEVATRVHVAPTRFDTPFYIGYLRLAEGPRVVARLSEDPATVAPDLRWEPAVEVVGRDDAGEVRCLVYHPMQEST